MQNQKNFLLALILTLFAFSVISCSHNQADSTATIPTPFLTGNNISLLSTPSPTLPPLLIPTQPTAIPYPTASTIKNHAVAFLVREPNFNYSLWVVNVDGSGERKLVDIVSNESNVYDIMLKWSPNGKWISYFSDKGLWIVSSDGSVNKKITSALNIFTYDWSPDSSQIAYESIIPHENYGPMIDPISIEIIDISTGEVTKLISGHSNYPMPLSWSPDGKYLLFVKDSSYNIYEIASRKVVKEFKPIAFECWFEWSTWSPNSNWFFTVHNSNGRYANVWACVSGIDGSSHRININRRISTPVWDKTGDFLYFVSRKLDTDNIPNLNIDEWLMRYNVIEQRTEKLLKLREKQTLSYIGAVSISPDGNTLMVQIGETENIISYILINLETFSITKFTHNSICRWSADNENLICLKESNYLLAFYRFNLKSGEITFFSGEHQIERFIISPILDSP